MNFQHQNHLYQILVPEWIVTVNPTFEVLTDFALVIKANKIHSIVAANELGDLDFFDQAKLYELPGQALMPGLVNSHTHSSMSLFRGMADDLALMDWLNNHIWPAEGKWINPQFITDGFELSAAEMIRSGTTCMNDMYFYPDLVARSAQKMGMRTVVGLIILDFPTVWAQNADDYLSKALAVHDEISELPLVSSAFAPHAPYTVSDAPLEKIAMYSSELELPVHMHIHETAFEVMEAEKNTGKRPFERLDQLNLVNPNLIAVHMTQLNDSEIDRLSETGAHVVHCPGSNLKLASGMCPVAALQDKAINVCLGTDSAASNNDLDMFGEMRTAALLAKGVSGNAAACNAQQTIQMATINGAKALGLGNDIGSIEIGKFADLIAVNLSGLNTQPLYDVVAQLVYATNSRQVSHVWIDGVCLLEDSQFSQIDEAAIIHKAKIWSNKISNAVSN
ncbi:MAG: 5-methylthioadenosine/S-adenosylhomocysteine deaminase [Gammaproteobacteria bacterium]|jgi:5-methylthioadenosine/S-adenosylhomocysteine deaminase